MDATRTLIAHVRAKPGQESRVRQVLEGLLAPTRAEAGCINYDLHQSQKGPRSVRLLWKREERSGSRSACSLNPHSILSKTCKRNPCRVYTINEVETYPLTFAGAFISRSLRCDFGIMW